MKPTKRMACDLAAWIGNFMKSSTDKSSDNSLRNSENERAWEEPIVGFSKGDDLIYEFFKEDIGDFYWIPKEIVSKTFPKLKNYLFPTNGHLLGVAPYKCNQN